MPHVMSWLFAKKICNYRVYKYSIRIGGEIGYTTYSPPLVVKQGYLHRVNIFVHLIYNMCKFRYNQSFHGEFYGSRRPESRKNACMITYTSNCSRHHCCRTNIFLITQKSKNSTKPLQLLIKHFFNRFIRYISIVYSGTSIG